MQKLYLNLADSLILKSYFFKRKLFSKSKADLNKGIKIPNYEGEFSQIILKLISVENIFCLL